MTGKDSQPSQAPGLRQQAEAKAREKTPRSPENIENLSPEEVRRLLHELQVHQIELEMQNEELRRAQAALDAERARYFDLYDLAPVGYVTVSEPGLILEANLAAATLLGTARGALVKQPISRFILKEDQDGYYLSRKQLFETGEPQTLELRMTSANSQPFWAHLSATVAQDGEGRRASRLVLSDVSERKRAELEHEQHGADKSRLENQLHQARKVEAIGRLAGGIAHDFNNMMAVVLGYGEMLLGHLGPGDPARSWTEQIMAAGQRSAALTRQLLAFSRKQTLKPEVLDLNAHLGNLAQMFDRLFGENIELEFKLDKDLGRTRVDPGQIEQVVMNLALNARDAMPLGGRLTIETANVELDRGSALGDESVLPGRYVLLAVTDTGCGMDKATLARLFEPFFTTKEQGKGTGLGLATAYGIVKQSGGYIWAYSEPGQGTIFKIYLPRTDVQLQALGVESVGGAPRGNGERILLVEDEASLRQMCETVLTGLGYRVSVAGSGPLALLLVEEKRLDPDLVLTDVIMPGISGAELAQRLRRDRPNLKVLFMSGYPDDAIARHGVLDPGTSFIQKPFRVRSLAVKVREVLLGTAAAARPGRRVLMIDDDEQFRELTQRFCTKAGHVFVGVDSAAAAHAALAGQPFDVLLVDLNIPGTSGEQVLRQIRAAGCAAPAIILTGEVAAANMDVLRQLGAVQALEKSGQAAPLLQAIAAA